MTTTSGLRCAPTNTVGSYPHFTDPAVARIDVDEDATRRTQPGFAVVASDAALTVR